MTKAWAVVAVAVMALSVGCGNALDTFGNAWQSVNNAVASTAFRGCTADSQCPSTDRCNTVNICQYTTGLQNTSSIPECTIGVCVPRSSCQGLDGQQCKANTSCRSTYLPRLCGQAAAICTTRDADGCCPPMFAACVPN